MAVMSRGKRAIAQGWALKNKQREQETLKAKEEVKKEMTPEEHEARIKKLKEMGLIK